MNIESKWQLFGLQNLGSRRFVTEPRIAAVRFDPRTAMPGAGLNMGEGRRMQPLSNNIGGVEVINSKRPVHVTL